MEQPKICPFCKSDDIDAEGWLDGNGNRGPECMGCGATAQSLHKWNSRPIEEKVAEAIEHALGHINKDHPMTGSEALLRQALAEIKK